MHWDNPIVLMILGVAAGVVGIWVVRRFLSDDARWERRRRRSNAPISSKARRPMIKFSVRTKKGRGK